MRKVARLAMPLLILLTALVIAAPALGAQKKPKDNLAGYDKSARATVLHPSIVYVAADENSQKTAEVLPGHEVVLLDRSGPWAKVFANTDTPDRTDPDRAPEFPGDDAQTQPISGWIKDKGIVSPQTPNGDQILFGTAATLEDEASRPHARKDAASEAHLLYERVSDYFPTSNLAGESAFRAADIRWQIEKQDISSLPSAKEQEAYLRPQLFDGDMKRVIKQYPNSEWAFRAAFDLLDNKLCGDWQGLPKCPEMESGLYLKYADQYRDSPVAPEAMYNAIYRQGVLVTMYRVEDDRKKADNAAGRTAQLFTDMRTRYPTSDYTRRAQSIAFRVQQGVNVYGNDRE